MFGCCKIFYGRAFINPANDKKEKYLTEDDVVGIIYPAYYFSVPLIVKSYLKKCKIKANYTFVIATYGNYAGGSTNEMKKLIKLNNNKG